MTKRHMLRQAIVTKYIGPSNVRGSRVKATAAAAAAGSITLSWDGALNVEDNHARAAKALADKYGWRGYWFVGGMPGDKGNVYVNCDDASAMEAVRECCVFVTEGRN